MRWERERERERESCTCNYCYTCVYSNIDLISLEENVYCLLNEILERKEIPVSSYFFLLSKHVLARGLIECHSYFSPDFMCIYMLLIPNGALAVVCMHIVYTRHCS